MHMGLARARMALASVGLVCLAFAQLAHAAVSISGTPARAVVVDRTYRFTPSYTASAGKAVTFSIVNKPTWASFNTSTGALTGTPGSSRIGTYSGISISVKDSASKATLPSFSIAVMSSSANHKPTISGTPPAHVYTGQAYSFVPKATDADGNLLQFSISSKPVWASFDKATGRLSGVPGSTQAGSYEEIRISVWDGGATAVLPLFAIDVEKAAAPPQSVTLSWMPPRANTDGSTLTNLAGYKIVYGTAPHTYTKSISISNPGLASYVIQNLPAGKYYFAIVAINGQGAESDPSAEVSVDLT